LEKASGVVPTPGRSGKPTTRRYSDDEKAQAVRLVRQLRVELGTEHGTVKRVADQLGYVSDQADESPAAAGTPDSRDGATHLSSHTPEGPAGTAAREKASRSHDGRQFENHPAGPTTLRAPPPELNQAVLARIARRALIERQAS
jgi:hypothetical protein